MRRSLIAALLSSASLFWSCATTPAVATVDAPPAVPVAPAPALSAMALSERGSAEYEAKQFATCASTFDAALARAQGDRQTESLAYNAACCHALAGNRDLSFARLEQATQAGFRDSTQLQKDTDLDALRADPRWTPLLEGVKASEARYLASVNPELKALFDADQADRQGQIDWKLVGPRDAERRAKVEALVKAKAATVADDWYHAAMVFQHGSTVEELARAHEFAGKALALQPDNGRARWLFAASKDRLLMRQEKPQLYGTQFSKVDGRWVLYPVDPSITDEERARYNVPPLAAARARAEQMNAQTER